VRWWMLSNVVKIAAAMLAIVLAAWVVERSR
jgi:hypothetical protein